MEGKYCLLTHLINLENYKKSFNPTKPSGHDDFCPKCYIFVTKMQLSMSFMSLLCSPIPDNFTILTYYTAAILVIIG